MPDSPDARNLSAWFYKGVEPKHVMARWMGKDQSPSHGRELGLFLADLEQYGLAPYHNGSMASWIPSGAGYALAFKLRRMASVYLAFTGEGATSPGDFYEGLNFASIHKLPAGRRLRGESVRLFNAPRAPDAGPERG